jgi:hypothetical protein
MTSYEVTKQKMLLTKESDLIMPEEANEIINIVNQFKDAEHNESWVEAMDWVPGLIVPGLVYIINKMNSKGLVLLNLF